MSIHAHLSRYRAETDDSSSIADPDQGARQQAIQRIELRRHFHIHAALTAIGSAILVVIWALSEYHNAGGWPAHGFSQSSGIHDVWNFWIVYPIGGLGLILAGRAWYVYGNKPISEHEIEREIDRQRAKG